MIGRVKRLHQARHVVRRIAIGDIAADGAKIPHLRVGNLQRRFADNRGCRGQHVAGNQLVLRGHRADGHSSTIDSDAFQRVDTAKIDQMADIAEPLLHHRDQAVPAGNDARVIPPLTEQTDHSVDAVGPVIIKRTRYHGKSSSFFQTAAPQTDIAARRGGFGSRHRREFR